MWAALLHFGEKSDRPVAARARSRGNFHTLQTCVHQETHTANRCRHSAPPPASIEMAGLFPPRSRAPAVSKGRVPEGGVADGSEAAPHARLYSAVAGGRRRS